MRQPLTVLIAALPGPALAQAAPAALPDAGAGLLQVLLGLAAVIVALFGCLWLLKRLSAQRGAAGALRIVAGAAVGPRERVVILEVENTWLVVGVAPGQVSALHRLPKGRLPAAAPVPAGQDFGLRLRQVMARKNDAR